LFVIRDLEDSADHHTAAETYPICTPTEPDAESALPEFAVL
jgi:hypothetical protein